MLGGWEGGLSPLYQQLYGVWMLCFRCFIAFYQRPTITQHFPINRQQLTINHREPCNHATLQLWVGAHLPDPAGIVEGTGKNLRHVKIKSADFENWDAVEQLMIENLRHLGWLDSE